MNYQSPKNILEVLQKIEYEDALSCDDPRYVETAEARGSQKTLDRLARKFGLILSTGKFYAPSQKHVLFFGHVGSGKTTELRRYAKTLNGADRFLVIEVDITVTLDRNNLKYADTLMAMAHALLNKLVQQKINLDSRALGQMEAWFAERVLTSEDLEQFSLDIQSGAKVSVGIPGLLKYFSRFTASFKTNATYKESLRRVIRNSFGEFAIAFNALLRDAEQLLDEKGIAKRVLFVIDGTDKLRGEDTRDFFVHDAEQLLAVEGLVIYTAPLSLKYESNLTGKLDADLVLPMIKLYDLDNTRWPSGWQTMRDILLLRADHSLFDGDAEIDSLIEYSGGHPREMLRLLKLCCEFCEQDSIDHATVELAINQLASEYRRFLEPTDYRLLKSIDQDKIHSGNDERTKKLLYNLALLEYNDGSWRRSHPVVRRLEGYRLADPVACNSCPHPTHFALITSDIQRHRPCARNTAPILCVWSRISVTAAASSF